VGGTSNCSIDPFNLTASIDTPPGYPAALEVTFTSANGSVQVETISIPLGTKSTTDPQGPDEYGYWCFDNTDQDYLQAPTYVWVELDPSYGGSGTQLPINDPNENADMSVNVPLPFTFQYYGEETDEITVCSNGWISTWANNSFADFRNYPIPSCIGPNGMIAAFWDDLVTWSGGHVYTWYDADQHRFIIEWSRMKTLSYPNTEEVFEIILFDPAYHPTVTGDGPIMFQYYSIADVYGSGDDNPYSTVGIERPDQQDGIEIVYWNTYEDPAAAQLSGGRAYLFTTDFDYITGPSELTIEVTYVSGSPVPAGGGELHYGVFIENQGIWPLDFEAWIDISYEGGHPATIIMRPFTNFQPGWTINRPDITFPVPASYAAGDYTLTGKLGDFPDIVWEESGFSWSKLGDGGDGSFIPWAPEGLENPFEEIITIAASQAVPDAFSFNGAYPNPFNPRTTLTFALPEAARVGLTLYDISGRQVIELVDGWRDAGVHEMEFDASEFASGVYLCRLQAGSFSATQKMVLLK
jgi:hypothetical protein